MTFEFFIFVKEFYLYTVLSYSNWKEECKKAWEDAAADRKYH